MSYKKKTDFKSFYIGNIRKEFEKILRANTNILKKIHKQFY